MGLDYSLSGDTLNRIKNAGVTRVPKTGIGEAISGIGETITDYATEGQDAMAGWDEGFAIQGDRGSWASGELFDQFQEMEAGYKEEFLQAAKRRDEQGKARLLKDQGDRSSSIQGWKDVMATAKQINDGVGWGKGLSNDDKYALGVLSRNDGDARVRMGDKGEMVFDIPLENGTTRTLTRREVDKMVAEGTNDYKSELDFMENNDALTKSGLNGDLFNFGTQKRKNRISLTPNKLPNLMNQEYAGGSFREHIKDHPDFQGHILLDGHEDSNNDGVINLYDLSADEMDLLIDEMEKTPEIAKDYVSDWMTLIQQRSWQTGHDEKLRRDEEQLRNSRSTSTTKLTSEERNKNRAEKDRLSMQQARSKPIMLNGLNFGLVTDYYRDETTGEWMLDIPFESGYGVIPDVGGPMKVDDIPRSQLPDPDLLKSEIERLQVELDESPVDTRTADDMIKQYKNFY